MCVFFEDAERHPFLCYSYRCEVRSTCILTTQVPLLFFKEGWPIGRGGQVSRRVFTLMLLLYPTVFIIRQIPECGYPYLETPMCISYLAAVSCEVQATRWSSFLSLWAWLDPQSPEMSYGVPSHVVKLYGVLPFFRHQ